MEVHLTEQFDEAYAKLTRAEKQSVLKALGLLGNNPRHPGLRTRKMEGIRDIWEARPSRRLGMTFHMARDVITVRNVGEHDNVLKKP